MRKLTITAVVLALIFLTRLQGAAVLDAGWMTKVGGPYGLGAMLAGSRAIDKHKRSATTLKEDLMPHIQYLGHAGFVVQHAGKRLVIDPWFSRYRSA